MDRVARISAHGRILGIPWEGVCGDCPAPQLCRIGDRCIAYDEELAPIERPTI